MNIEKTVLQTLSEMASGTGKARSERLLYIEIQKKHPGYDGNNIWNAIHSCVEKEYIKHDEKMSDWIAITENGRQLI